MEEFQVMGFVDIVRKLPAIWKQFHVVRDHILNTKPDVTVLIDYPGFNLRLAKSLRKKGYQGKIVHYICPTIWAWGYDRIHTLVKTLDLLLTIFPFEPPLFAKTPLEAQFVGHPLVEALQKHPYNDNWYQSVGLPHTDHLIALFPGSRPGEIHRFLKRQLQAALRLRQDSPSVQIAISCADSNVIPLVTEIAEEYQLTIGKDLFLVPREYSYDLMKACRCAIAKSGTVNLEIALHGKPAVVVYEVSLINYLIMWYVLRLYLSYYSIVNILCDRSVYPELMQEDFTADNVYNALKPLYQEGPARDACIRGCQEAKALLGTEQTVMASQHAAQAITKLCVP
jgi:lipid-A-disaccharide synthase